MREGWTKTGGTFGAPLRLAPVLLLSLTACGAEADSSAGPGEGNATAQTCDTNPNLAECGSPVRLLRSPEGYLMCDVTNTTTHGDVAVGSCLPSGDSPPRSARWDRSGALTFLDLDGLTQASGVSADGSVTVGVIGFYNEQGYRYDTALREHVDVGLTSVSSDGTVFVGNGFGALGDWDSMYSVRGQAGQPELQPLAPIAEGLATKVFDVSKDGNISVGIARDAQQRDRAAYWTRDGELHLLPEYPGAVFTQAVAVNGDGSVIIGTVYLDETNDISYPVRWTEAGIERLGDQVATSFDVSEDGRRILLDYGGPIHVQAIWTETSEQPIHPGLSPSDFGLPSDDALKENLRLWGLTPDGLGVFGQSYTPDGDVLVFVARLPE